jgi:hypothetical protein
MALNKKKSTSKDPLKPYKTAQTKRTATTQQKMLEQKSIAGRAQRRLGPTDSGEAQRVGQFKAAATSFSDRLAGTSRTRTVTGGTMAKKKSGSSKTSKR